MELNLQHLGEIGKSRRLSFALRRVFYFDGPAQIILRCSTPKDEKQSQKRQGGPVPLTPQRMKGSGPHGRAGFCQEASV